MNMITSEDAKGGFNWQDSNEIHRKTGSRVMNRY